MKPFLAFTKKEWLEQMRSGRILILGILFVLLGIMNPALAKLTPWLFETMADSLAESGISFTAVTVDAMTSWTQFFKNIPMGLIAFVLLQSNLFTKEYQSGTLIPALTKGLERYKIVLSKTAVLTVLWSLGYLLCFAITYGYNEFFWDNGIARNLAFSVTCWWLLGLFAVMLTVLFSAVAASNTAVLTGVGGIFLAAYCIGLFPKAKAYSPSMLMDSASLLSGAEDAGAYAGAVAVTVVLCVLCLGGSIPVFDGRRV